jgi:acyl carrier protein
MLSREKILEHLTICLGELFEVPPEKVVPDARLYEDLDIDSIDAVDLVVQLQQLTRRRFTPEEFRSVRTVSDVVDRVCELAGEPVPR